MSPLRTPEQVSADLGSDDAGRPIVAASTIRSMARANQIEHLRLGRSKIAFTDEQVTAMLAKLTKSAPRAERSESVFGASKRSSSTPRTAR